MKLLVFSLLFVGVLLLGCSSQQSPSPTAQGSPSIDPQTGALIMDVDDHGIYPDTVYFAAGEHAKLLLRVSAKNVYFGGVGFKGELFTLDVPIGEQKLVEFTMPDKDVSFITLWPANQVKKADGWIKVRK